ncbi:NAD-dependent epimerase/dehydratase family protein [Streptomyces sp. NPDC091292]|uniref:NAD-dependent epimerase/dehydratase family protein n=1 Tax=Streptomyces sp. NPDC091292 TaxID=3365991 RepID=UPI00381B6D01
MPQPSPPQPSPPQPSPPEPGESGAAPTSSARRILLTGAAGRIGTVLRSGLAHPDRVLRLLDVAPQRPADPDERVEIVRASFTDPHAIRDACRGVDAVVHFGGCSGEAPWETVRAVNVDGTQMVLAAAAETGVRRVVLAGSIHAVGFRNRDETAHGPLPADSPARPDTFYGVSKAAVEALGSLYHSRFGIDVTCLRIGAFRPRPAAPEDLAAWLSPADAVRLVEACLRVEPAGFRVLWGISANTRRWWSHAEAEAIGYHPQDDAERYADQIPGHDGAAPATLRTHQVGAGFCTMPLG